MNASVKLLHKVLPTSVGLRVAVPAEHPSAQILGTQRMGSGTLVDDGIVLTVNYVVIGAESIEVTLLDNTSVTGEVVAQDFFAGLAAIKLNGPRYPVAGAQPSQQLAAGQEIFIVASAGGNQRRVNSGAVTSLAPFDAFWEFRLERGITTTAMNPGLGGGGLFTTQGLLTGVISLDLSEVGRFTLAVPVEHFLDHRSELLEHGRRVSRQTRAWVGLYCYVLRDHVVIAGVLPGAPGENAGLVAGDVILAVDGTEVHNRSQLYERIWARAPGDEITFRVYNNDAMREVRVHAADAELFFA